MVRVAAVSLLPRAARGADGRARDHRRPHEEQRARRDEGVRHQPVSCGRSLLILALIGSVILMGLEEGVLASRIAAPTRSTTRFGAACPTTHDLNRRWVTANNGNIYQYLYFESGPESAERPVDLRVRQGSVTSRGASISRTRRSTAIAKRKGQVQWQGGKGWQREFEPKTHFTSFTGRPVVDGRAGVFR